MASRKKTTKKPTRGSVRAPIRKTVRRPAGAHRDSADSHAADELVLYIDNTSDLSLMGPSGQGHSVALNALRKWRKGVYQPELAVKLFGYLVEAGAKRYAKEFDSPSSWSTMFTPATRELAARELEKEFRRQAEQGEFDHLDKRPGAGAREARHRRPVSSHRMRVAARDRDRPISMTYGVLPPFREFEKDIRRPNPDNSDGSPYLGPDELYPMELVSSEEIDLAESFGDFEEFRGQYGKRGFRGDTRQIYAFLEHLVEEMNNAEDPFEEGGPGDLASSIMTTLGYEWI